LIFPIAVDAIQQAGQVKHWMIAPGSTRPKMKFSSGTKRSRAIKSKTRPFIFSIAEMLSAKLE